MSETYDKKYDSLMFKKDDPTTNNIIGATVKSNLSDDSSGITSTSPANKLGDLWIRNFIRSENWKPKTTGFTIDGRTGYAEFSSGWFGAWNILSGSIYYDGATDNLSSGMSPSDYPFYAGKKFASRATAPFRVTTAGEVYASNITIVGGIIDGTSTIGGRTASTLAAAIDASGHFADDAINTASSTILGGFTFGVSGALQIGTYESGVSGDLKISPNGILARDKTGATTFSINGTTGVAVLNGLVVGTNVGLGTAQDSTGVTTIIGNTVTTGFVNALNVKAGSVDAEDITGTYITGKTIRTSDSSTRVEMTASGDYSNCLTIYQNGNERVVLGDGVIGFFNASGVGSGEIYGYGTNQLGFDVSGSGDYIMNESGFIPLTSGSYDLGSSYYKWNQIYTNNITLGGTSRSTWPSAGADSLSDLSIDTAKSWGSYGISGLGTITPYSSAYYDLGSSSRYWHNLYLDYLRLNSSYGQIYWGSDLCFDFYSNRIDVGKAIKLLTTSTTPGSAVNGMMFYHTTYHEVWVFKNGAWKALAYVP